MMAEPMCEDEGLLQEWSPLTQLVQQIPLKIQKGLFSQNLNLTCLDVISEYIALGTNSNFVFWYSRVNGEWQRLQLENSHGEITCVKVVSSVEYMVAAGTNRGVVTVFQIPKVVPESIPNQLKPKKKQIERFTICGLHSAPVTNIEWSQNGMKLFSGDKNGVVVLTEIDFALHLTKSVELINEQFEIIQLSYSQQILLISTVYRSIVCDGTNNWSVHQVGTKERKILGKFGATFCRFDHGLVLYASRPGCRLWLADKIGIVQQTLIFKPAIQSTCPKIQLINPVNKTKPFDISFGKVIQFGDNKLITYNSEVLYVLHPGAVSVVAVLHNVRKILDLAINENEIFILEGERSLLRISPVPDKYSLELLYHPISRKTTFNLDEFAAKIKDTAVGSIKKITKELIVLPEEFSTNSPPIMADEAVELPPIVYLPDGSVPNIFSDGVRMQYSFENNNEEDLSSVLFNDVKRDQEKLSDRPAKDSNTLFNQDCHEEVISRPLRKKRNKKPKKLLNSQVLESESDTTSNASDDRLTWGIANDMSLSDESAISLSHSSFSVLRDIPTLANLQKPELGKGRFAGAEEIRQATSDGKSQTSIDTCESVSEFCQQTTSEERERAFARLANHSLLDSFNSEKTDNMSISLNMTTPSSVSSSKTSGNLPSPSDYSENSSLISRGKNHFQDGQGDGSEEPNYCRKDGHFQDGNHLSGQEEREISSSDSLLSVKNLHGERFYASWSGTRDNCNDETIKLDKHFSHPNPQNLENNESDVKFKESCFLDSPETNATNPKFNKENFSPGFRINNLSDFFSQELLERENTREPPSIRFFGNGNGKEEEENGHSGTTYPSAIRPISYGPPSGSSTLNLNVSQAKFSSRTKESNWQASKSRMGDFSDHWPQYKTPEPITSLAVSRNYALCTDVNDHVYYSDLSGLTLCWVLLDYKASSVRVSNDGSVAWLLIKKSVFSLINPSQKSPIASAMEEVASDVASFAVDFKTNDGWIVTQNGKIICHYHSPDVGDRKQVELLCDYPVKDIACSDGVVVLLTGNGNLLCKPQRGKEFRVVNTFRPMTTSIALGFDNLLWVVDDRNNIYFSDDFLEEDPHWWQIQISDYIFHNSSMTFQNIYSKIKLNNLKANIHAKTTCIASNENSVWIYEKFSSFVRLNKSDFTGYIWNEVPTKKCLTQVKWQSLSGEGVFEEKGHVWFLSADGNIFCNSPKSNEFQTIPVPCEDEVLCMASSSDTLWVLSENGRVYSRLGLTDRNLLGNSWRELKLPQTDNLRLVWVSCGCDVAWGCDVQGRTFITIGSPHHMATNIFDAAWLEVEGRPKGVQFEKVFVGPHLYMVWAIDGKGNLYVREGIFSHYQIGTSWVYVGGIEAVHVSISGTSVWALTSGGHVYRRCGISETNYIGDYWKSIPGTFKVVTSSFTDELWGITHGNEIMRLSYSIRILGKGKANDLKEKESHSSKEDVSWEIVE